MTNRYDLAIVGCGPAGLSAALNCRIRRKNFIILGTEFCSPKMHVSPWVDNYLGEFHISGKELRGKFLEHVKKAGIEIVAQRVDGIYPDSSEYFLQCGQEIIPVKTVILATGVEYGKKIDGEDKFIGKGVSYCATCDGPLYSGKKVAMLVYSRDGLDEMQFLAQTCREVILFPLFNGNLSGLADNVIVNQAKPLQITGRDTADMIITDQGNVLVDGIFLFREVVPPSRLIPGVEMVEGVIKVSKNMETNLPGLYAAGDCTGKPYQLAKAVGEGQVAALQAVHYLDNH